MATKTDKCARLAALVAAGLVFGTTASASRAAEPSWSWVATAPDSASTRASKGSPRSNAAGMARLLPGRSRRGLAMRLMRRTSAIPASESM